MLKELQTRVCLASLVSVQCIGAILSITLPLRNVQQAYVCNVGEMKRVDQIFCSLTNNGETKF